MQAEAANLQAPDLAALLAKWDANEPVWSVEMGGLGPGYEQAIQISAFEVLRHLVAEAPDAARWGEEGRWAETRASIEASVGPQLDSLGLSGAQWGAAMNLGTVMYRSGPDAFRTAPEDRHILVSKASPTLATAAA